MFVILLLRCWVVYFRIQVSYASDGWKLYKESEEARKQIEMEKLEREALSKFQAEVEKAQKEKRDEHAEGEPPDDTKQLRN